MLKKEKDGSIKNAADKVAGAGHIDVCMHLDNAPNMPGCEGLKCTSCMIPNLNTEND